MHKHFLLLYLCISSSCLTFAQRIERFNQDITAVAKKVISRTIGNKIANRIKFEPLPPNNEHSIYEYRVSNGKLIIKGNSAIALCQGFYNYLKTSDQGMITWSGKNLQIKSFWKPVPYKHTVSPYRYHYYMNVVTHGYSTAYWSWDRWQRELDWMALHGMDMLMLNNAYEAIMSRVFQKEGLPDTAISSFFPGPSFQPWNRMGNITGWDGPPPPSWYIKQIELTHKVLSRMKELGITPVIQSFAGFVPNELSQVYPSAKVTPLTWNSSYPEKYRCGILLPDSGNKALFIKTGQLFVQEWEKEFGKGEYYLSDGFNEMKVPRTANESEKDFQNQLSEYGKVIYQSLYQANDSAVWVMQGWTFGYQREEWNKDRLAALVSKVPDNNTLFLDLANEYNLNFWKISPNWEYYDDFFKKQWIYSFIPNMGGKTAWNGILKTYADAPITALGNTKKSNLIGFGFAPEGIENNELVYELLSDMGWRNDKIDLDNWLEDYCIQRYGGYRPKMKAAFQCFLKSCYGTFTDHPRFAYQSGENDLTHGSVNKNPEFFEGVKLFLSCANDLNKSALYQNDAIELTAQYLSLTADSLVHQARKLSGRQRTAELNKAYSVLENRLQSWVSFAKKYGDNAKEQQYYAQDARRIITTWGPGVNDYAAKMWSGLIGSYYLPRLKMVMEGKDQKDIAAWEENWIQHGDNELRQPFAHPIEAAQKLIQQNPW
jgi:alpha-N-acetylglucosaminidase